MTRRAPVHVALLALLVTACVPPDPFEFVDTSSDLPSNVCRGSYVEVGPGRWQLERQIWGSSTTTRPGELAAAELEIKAADWPSRHLLDMRLELEVVAGQALPGQALLLQHGSEPLQEVKLSGPNGNEALFDVGLPRDLCGSPCTLSLSVSGPAAESDVPIPLRLRGKLVAFVDSGRETRPCHEDELTLVVIDAP